MAPVGVRDVKGSSAIQSLSVEAVEFSPALVPEKNVMSGRKTRQDKTRHLFLRSTYNKH